MTSRKIPLTAKIAPEIVANLDYIAKHLGVTKSALVSKLIENGIKDYLDAAKEIHARSLLTSELDRAVELSGGWVTRIE